MNDSNTTSEFKQWGINRYAYVNQFKQIPNSNPPAFTVSLCEPHGRKDNNHYVYYDLTIKELAPFSLLNEHKSSIGNEDSKVSIRFNCYNCYPRPFAYKDEKGKVVMEGGEPKLGASMRGFLSSISRMTIDNKVVYQYQERTQEPAEKPKPANNKLTKLPKKSAKNA